MYTRTMAQTRADQQAVERGLHRLRLATQHHLRALRKILLGVVDDLVDLCGHIAKIHALD